MAIATETTYNVSPNLSGKLLKFKFTAAGTGDYIVFDVPIGACYLSDLTGAQATALYATGAGTDDAAGVLTDDADDDTFTYDDVTAATELPETLGYIMMENEIMQYTAGGAGATGTFTGLKRGMFGTTVAAHAQNVTFYILNTLIVTTSAAGLVRGIADVIEE